MPGSRASEIKLLAPRFLQAAQILLKQDPDLQILVPMVNAERRREFQALLEQYPVRNCRIIDQAPTASSGVPAVSAQDTAFDTRPAAWNVMEAADAVLVASGTATLAAALFKRPKLGRASGREKVVPDGLYLVVAGP